MAREMVQGIESGAENIWACFDELVDSLKTEEDWSRKHGADWTLADVPYHMMYTERDLVAGALRRGQDVPESEQKVQDTIRELNAWNAAKFAERSPTATGPESLTAWRTGQDAVRKELSTLQDEDLMSRMTWFPLVGAGWVPAMVPASFAVSHGWSEFIQLRHLLGGGPEPDPLTTHLALGTLQGFMPLFLDRENAQGVTLTVVFEYTGSGGGEWTLRVADGTATVTEERAGNPDLVITQSPETFELIRQSKLDPMQAMQTGAFNPQPAEAMATFGALFPPPTLDKKIPAMGVGALG